LTAAPSLCVGEAIAQLVRPIYPRYANRYGTLHGGYAAWWLLETGAMAAVRAARGYAVLGAIEHLYIHSPGRLGENVFVYAAVIGSTEHTLDVAAVAVAEPVGGGAARLVATSLQTYVAVDEEVRSRRHGVRVAPCGRWQGEEDLYRVHLGWLERRRRLLPEARGKAGELLASGIPGVGRIESLHVVSMEDTFTLPGVLDAARLFYLIDQVAAVAAIKSLGGPVVTAGFDEAFFLSPARLGDIVSIDAALTGAGRTSVEALLRVRIERPSRDEQSLMAILYATLVSIGDDGRPAPPRRRPEIPAELQEGYLERRRRRSEARRRAEEMAEALLSLVRSRGLVV